MLYIAQLVAYSYLYQLFEFQEVSLQSPEKEYYKAIYPRTR